MNLKTYLGEALFQTHGDLCQSLINNDYNIEDFYTGGNDWGDFSRVYIQLAIDAGVTTYEGFLVWFGENKQDNDLAPTRQLWTRQTGIKKSTQNIRTYKYRVKQRQELNDLREAVALKWIDENREQAINYLKK